MKHMAKKMTTFFVAFALLATTLLSALPAMAYAAPADNQSASQYFGVSIDDIVAELDAHKSDGYYLGTPYRDINTGYNDAQNRALCLSPNGDPTGEGPGMNCTGFVAYVLQKCGGDIGKVMNNYDPIPTGVANAINWRRAMMGGENVEYYKYDTVADLLSAGIAQKGDIIYCNPVDWEDPGQEGNSYPIDDCHIGFFWGNNAYDNRMWHSTSDGGNHISDIVPKTEPSVYYLVKMRPGEIAIEKESANKSITNGNDCYSLAGAVYGIYKAGDNTKVGEITLDAAGKGSKKPISNGSYYVQEISPPTNGSYQLDTTKYPVTISGNKKTIKLNLDDKPTSITDPVAVLLYKADSETLEYDPQGDGSLAGAQFTIKYYDGYYTASNLPNSATRTWVFRTDADGMIAFDESAKVSGDSLYYSSTGKLTMPLGTVTVQETKAPTGYNINDKLFVQQITANSSGDLIKVYNTVDTNDIIKRGGVKIPKIDKDRGTSNAQGDATLQNATFSIYNMSTKSVRVAGTDYATGAKVYTFQTNAAGVAQTANDLLPFGTYKVVESTAPTGYLNTGNGGTYERTFTIRTDKEIVDLTGTPIVDPVIRGGVYIEKWDNELDKYGLPAHWAQGGATLKGTAIDIINRSAKDVYVNGVWYAPGQVVYKLVTDDKGEAATASNLLPYGTYEIVETAPPKGYLATGTLKRTVQIRTEGKMEKLNETGSAIKNNPIRGDLEGVKINENMGRMSNVQFKITSKTTGESHIVVTDDNGKFSTASAWNPHSQNTNRGETEEDGVWFGEIETLDDSLGALLYDVYIIEEMPCAANMGMELCQPFEVTVKRNNETVPLGTITNYYTPPPEIGTTAKDKANGNNKGTISKTTTIVDTVKYKGLDVGREYTVVGTLMDKATGNELLIDGQKVTATAKFTPDAKNGSVDVEFTFDTTGLAGKSVVVFEDLYFEDIKLGTHADIEDEGQTIDFPPPEIRTTAIDKATGSNEGSARKTTTIVDTVRYTGLAVGQKYTVEGVLMDKSTGKELLIDGQKVTASAEFTAETKDGSVEVEFTFDTTGIMGKSVVVFETLYVEGVELATHADINDKGQTVDFPPPEIGTTAKDKATGTHEAAASKTTTIIDTVMCKGLAVSQKYTVEGVLMDKASGEPLLIDGKKVTASTTFTAESKDGSVEVAFTFNTTGLAGKSVVVFETLYVEGIELATHADINDKGQTIDFKPITGKVVVYKVDADEKTALAGAEFTIYDSEGNSVVTITSGKDGRSEYTLPAGDYTVKETKAPDGYNIDDNHHKFSIKQYGAEVPVTVANSKLPGTVTFDVPEDVKRFPKTGVESADEPESITEEYEFTMPDTMNPHYDAEQTIKLDGKTYTLQSIEYALKGTPITKTVRETGLTEKKMPKTITVTVSGEMQTLTLQSVDYTENTQQEQVSNLLDYGYAVQTPTAPQTDTVYFDGYGDVELHLTSVEPSEAYGWHDVPVTATFYGSAKTTGFKLGDTIMQNTQGDPPCAGYEAEIIAYLGLNPETFRITGARWIDSDFVDGARHAEFNGQVYTTRWVANYTGTVNTAATYDAVAEYSNGIEGYEYVAIATYEAEPTPAAPTVQEKQSKVSTPVIVVCIVGVVIVAGLIVWLLLIFAKKRKAQEQVNE